MHISTVYFLDVKGKVILSRSYRGDVPSSVIERFQAKVIQEEDVNVKPVFTEADTTFCWVKYNNVYVVAVTANRNINTMVVFTFLYKLIELVKDYFKDLEEESLRDNFSITYELLDEILDHGYPQFTEAKILREYIKTEAHALDIKESKVCTAVTNAVSWRSEGIKYRKNEAFLDVIEKLSTLVSANGTVLRSEILGSVKMKVFLSGMPELKLGLNDKLMFESSGRPSNNKAVDLEDIKFHQCVRLARFENDRTISFIPPDGEFELMSYRVNTPVKPLFWIESVIEPHSSRIEYMIKVKSQFKARSVSNNVEIRVPVPPDAATPTFQSSLGTVKYLPDSDEMVWSIKQFPGQKEFLMRAHFSLPSLRSDDKDSFMKKPIAVNFEIPYFTVSGIQVRYLKIIEKSGYQAVPWVRYITQNGNYQVRLS